ncbi:type II toxin-antitoxin system prevent-host-death family antitoxin [Neisseria weixii]|uniref:Antitoxin n=1 Tax=Neisseria weixii TaxID=1853276 RepID=A0A3N4MSB8_9NEIS|nr:type II toxin-antitoxin system prevent-host-death family antitoxin [Neisseria weixii]RPD86148.1 type II toxin-antitoxin system prevent-host-death family antitoxin [Neisseria weixii]RPD86881.1 type II toxin-antitoxin system prevent-host-death family antitoxin [Neisseria weixii]
MSATVLSYSEARGSLKQVMDDVCHNHSPAIITRRQGEHVVMMSLDDYNSMEETLYLLKSPANAAHLYESIEAVKAGKTFVRDLPNVQTEATE